jgi:hypothetical protein
LGGRPNLIVIGETPETSLEGVRVRVHHARQQSLAMQAESGAEVVAGAHLFDVAQVVHDYFDAGEKTVLYEGEVSFDHLSGEASDGRPWRALG